MAGGVWQVAGWRRQLAGHASPHPYDVPCEGALTLQTAVSHCGRSIERRRERFVRESLNLSDPCARYPSTARPPRSAGAAAAAITAAPVSLRSFWHRHALISELAPIAIRGIQRAVMEQAVTLTASMRAQIRYCPPAISLIHSEWMRSEPLPTGMNRAS